MEIMKTTRAIGTGVYLVIDPAMDKMELYDKLDAVLAEAAGGIAALQIWDHFRDGGDIPELINRLCQRCHGHDIPVLINHQRPYLQHTPLDRVHVHVILPDYGA